jgi:hypothetical protein
LRVLVANGDGVPCQGVTHNVPLSIDTEAFSISCFGITLGSFDLILDYDFLRTLGPILWDFARHRMTFTRGDHRVTWLGVGASTDIEPAVRAAITPAGRPLLDQFRSIFEEPPRAAARSTLRPQDPPPARHGSSSGATVPLPALTEGRA